MYWGLKLWNNLSEDFKYMDSVHIFKSRIVRQLMNLLTVKSNVFFPFLFKFLFPYVYVTGQI